MKTGILKTGLLILLLIPNQLHAQAVDANAKEKARVEERMKDEKRRDEQQAKDYANRVKVARFDSVWRTPRSDDIDVIQAGESASRPYKAVALLTFECALHEEAQAVAGFIAKTKDLGGDGVIMIRFDAPNSNQAVNNIISPNDRRVFRANAIVYQGAK